MLSPAPAINTNPLLEGIDLDRDEQLNLDKVDEVLDSIEDDTDKRIESNQ